MVQPQMSPRIVAGAVAIALFMFGTACRCHACNFDCAGGKQQDALQLSKLPYASRSPKSSVPAVQHRKLLQTPRISPLAALGNLLRRLGVGNNGNDSIQMPKAAAEVQRESLIAQLTLEQGASPYVAANLPVPSSTSALQQGALVYPQSTVTYSPSTYTSTSLLPTISYSSSNIGVGTQDAVPGPLTQRAGVAGTLIGMAGDTAGQFKADRAAARAAFISKPGSAGHTVVTNTGAIQGELLSGGGHMVGQAVSALGQVGDHATSVTHQVAGNLGAGTGGLFNMAGRFVSTLAQLTGPGKNVATKTGKLEYVSPYGSSYSTLMGSDSGTTIAGFTTTADYP